MNDNSKQQNFQIYLRLKPRLTPLSTFNDLPNPDDYEQTIRKLSDTRLEMICPYYTDNDKTFQFDHIFDGEINNSELFERSMNVPIHNVLNGFNSTVLIYGMTGAGKTYTMFGAPEVDEARTSDGLVYLTLTRLFELVRKETDSKTKITLSFYEIYNQTIRDLMKESSANLNILQDATRGVFIADITEQGLETEHQARAFVKEGIQRRAMNATRSNEVSSRSHAIIQLTLKRFTQDPNTSKARVTESKLFLIDLAGNEKSYSNTNKRFVEGVNINKSLLTLGKCINILAEQKKGQFVPFRDSKLTRILKESLGGNAKTVMVACVSPERKYYEQTLNTLKYSCLAKNIKNKTSKNIRDATKSDLATVRNQCVALKSERSLDEDPDSYFFELLSDLFANIERKAKSEIVLANLKEAKAKQPQVNSETTFQLNQMIIIIDQERAQILEEGERFYKSLVDLVLSTKQTKPTPKGNSTPSNLHTINLQKTLKEQAKQMQAYKRQIQTLKKQLAQKDSLILQLKDQSALRQLKVQPNIPQQTTHSTVPLNHAHFASVQKKEETIQSVRSSLFGTNHHLATKRTNSNGENVSASSSQIFTKMKIRLTSPESKRGGMVNDSSLSIKNTSKVFEEDDNKQNSGLVKTKKSYLDKKPKQIVIDLHDRLTKEQFVEDMKQVERILKDGKCAKEIQRILGLQEEYNFELNGIEQSIFRKLKFFLKEQPSKNPSTEKSLPSKQVRRSISKKSFPIRFK